MQRTKIAIAIAVGLVTGSAFAITPVGQIAISSGASASKGNFKLALAIRCPGQLGEFIGGNANISTYVCAPAASFANANAPTAAEYNAAGSVPFTGTAIAEVRLNVSGGSFTSACLTAGWPAATACPAPDLYRDPAAGINTAAPAGSVIVGGLTDVEPLGFLSSVRAGISLAGTTTQTATFGQTFGVAVSNDLYAAMFANQFAQLGAGCAVTNTERPECVPVIGRAQMATIMSNDDQNAAYTNGAQFLTPLPGPQVPAASVLKYLRRVDTSGTQAVAQQYFLGNVCTTGTARGVVPQPTVSPTTIGALMAVFALGGTGDVRAQLILSGFAIGVMSGENNQNQNWKWLRVGGMNMAQSAQPAQAGVSFTNTRTALDGQYDFWFQSRIIRPNTPAAAGFWTSVNTGFGAVPVNTTVGLFRTNETGFARASTGNCPVIISN